MTENLNKLVITLVATAIVGLAAGLMFTVEWGVAAGVFTFGLVLHILFQIKSDKEKKIRHDSDGNIV